MLQVVEQPQHTCAVGFEEGDDGQCYRVPLSHSSCSLTGTCSSPLPLCRVSLACSDPQAVGVRRPTTTGRSAGARPDPAGGLDRPVVRGRTARQEPARPTRQHTLAFETAPPRGSGRVDITFLSASAGAHLARTNAPTAGTVRRARDPARVVDRQARLSVTEEGLAVFESIPAWDRYLPPDQLCLD